MCRERILTGKIVQGLLVRDDGSDRGTCCRAIMSGPRGDDKLDIVDEKRFSAREKETRTKSPGP